MWCHPNKDGYWFGTASMINFKLHNKDKATYLYDNVEAARNDGWYFWEGVL